MSNNRNIDESLIEEILNTDTQSYIDRVNGNKPITPDEIKEMEALKANSLLFGDIAQGAAIKKLPERDVPRMNRQPDDTINYVKFLENRCEILESEIREIRIERDKLVQKEAFATSQNAATQNEVDRLRKEIKIKVENINSLQDENKKLSCDGSENINVLDTDIESIREKIKELEEGMMKTLSTQKSIAQEEIHSQVKEMLTLELNRITSEPKFVANYILNKKAKAAIVDAINASLAQALSKKEEGNAKVEDEERENEVKSEPIKNESEENANEQSVKTAE